MAGPNDDYIKRIIAAKKADIDAFKAQIAARRGGRKKKSSEPISDADREDAGFATRNQRAIQQNNPAAMMGASNAPMAPPGVGAATRPIMTPQSGGGIHQGYVNAINQAAMAHRWGSPPQVVHDEWTRPATAEEYARNTVSAYARDIVNSGSHPAMNYAPKAPDPSRGIQYDQIRDVAQAGRKFIPRSGRGALQIESDPSPDSMRDEIIRDETRLRAAVKKAIRTDAKEIVRDLREAGRKEASDDLMSRKQYRRMRASIHPDYRADFDKASGFTTSNEDRISDLEEGGKASKGKQSNGGEWAFKINRLVHLVNKIAHAASIAQPINTAEAQMGPYSILAGAVAPIVGGPAGMTLYAAAEAINFYKAKAESAQMSTDAIFGRYKNSIGFGDDNTLSRISRAASERVGSGMTHWEKLSRGAGFAGATDSAAAVEIANQSDSYKHGRSQPHIYAPGAGREMINFAAKNKVPLASIGEYESNRIIDAEMDKERSKILADPAFEAAVQMRMPHNGGSGFRNALQMQSTHNRIAREMLAEIQTGKAGADLTKFAHEMDRSLVDEIVTKWIGNHRPEIHKQDELSRNIELKMKAERHRHLAEF